MKRILFSLLAATLAGISIVEGSDPLVSVKCLQAIESTLEWAEREELPATRPSVALPVECQYHQFKELDSDLRKRVQKYLLSIGKSATLDQKLTEILTLLKSKSLKRAADKPVPASQNWLFRYNSEKCPDYTGRALQECEARNYAKYTIAECDSVLEYAQRCKNLRRCNPQFKPGKICSKPEDFAPKR